MEILGNLYLHSADRDPMISAWCTDGIARRDSVRAFPGSTTRVSGSVALVTNVIRRYFGPPTTLTNPNMWSLIEWTRFMQITRKRPVFSNLY